VDLLSQAITAGNHVEIAKIAHMIRGSAGSYGYGSIADVAGHLEVIARSKSDLGLMIADCSELRALCAGVQMGVASFNKSRVSGGSQL
jgi:hypothetical protein